MAHDDVTFGLMARMMLKKINGLVTRIELTPANFNATTMKFTDKFDHNYICPHI